MTCLSKKWRKPQSREAKYRNEKSPHAGHQSKRYDGVTALKVSPHRSLFEKLAANFDEFISGGPV
jgi:hypothetical protein